MKIKDILSCQQQPLEKVSTDERHHQFRRRDNVEVEIRCSGVLCGGVLVTPMCD